MKDNITEKTGGKTFLYSIIFNIAVQIGFSFVLVAVLLFSGAESVDRIPGYSTWNLVAMFFLQAAFAAACFVVRPKLTPVPKQNASAWIKQIVFAVGTGLVCLTCFSWLGEWFAVFLDSVGYNLSDVAMNGTLDVIIAVAVTVIIAPIVEETVFRNAVAGELNDIFGTTATVALSGLCFALMHMSPQQTVYQFCLGCACAYAFIKTGNVVCSMIIHAVNNGCAIALSFSEIPLITPKEGHISVLTENPAVSVPVTLLLAAFGAAIIYYAGKLSFGKSSGKKVKDAAGNAEKRDDNTVKFSDVKYYIIALSVCAVMWICNFIGSMQ